VRGPAALARAADDAMDGAGAYAYRPEPYHLLVSSSHEYIALLLWYLFAVLPALSRRHT